ncbi:MAG: hypothetical protein FWB72_05940 [Firmicutes bacterium]|nr:hypothetical protein [Bacillota bacterium]
MNYSVDECCLIRLKSLMKATATLIEKRVKMGDSLNGIVKEMLLAFLDIYRDELKEVRG